MKDCRSSTDVSGVPQAPTIDHIEYQGSHRLDQNFPHDETPVSFEALLRSLDLLELSRRHGEMHILTCGILRIVCEEIRDTGNTSYPVHINLPPSCMTYPMVQDILGIVDGYGIPHNLIGFEILEHPFTCTEEVILVAHSLHASGFHLYLDDYQGLDHQREALHWLPIDVVKIDRAYLHSFSTVLTQTLLDLETAGFRSFIIEGAESPLHMSMIRWAIAELHPDTEVRVQGFKLSRPSPDALRRQVTLH